MLAITLRPDGRRAVIAGGGAVAARKASALLDAGFRVTVVATAVCAELRALSERPGLDVLERPYESSDLEGAWIAIAATGDDAINALVVRDARAARVLASDARTPERGDFTMPALQRAGDLTIAVDSGGASPHFSARVARELGRTLGPEYAAAARVLGAARTYAKSVLPAGNRGEALRRLAERPIAELAAMTPSDAEHAVDVVASDPGAAGATPHFTCATRASALATVQARAVAAKLAQRGIATTMLVLSTAGDRDRTQPIESLGSINVFVTELEAALREKRADYAVHSCKDLPSELAADMQLAAVSVREDPRDAFCSERYASFDALPPGAVVGTSSPRRRLQLAALRPDLEYRDMRGNVDTRLRRLRENRYDAIVLAMAGLNRLRIRATHTAPFAVEAVVPAAGQGALAIETRVGDEHVAAELRAAVNDAGTELCVRCERAALRALRGGCSAPIGIHAAIDAGRVTVSGARVLDDGVVLRAQIAGDVLQSEQAERLGAELAQRLRVPRSFVVLARTQARPSRIAQALRDGGIEVAEVRVGDDGPDPDERTPDMLLFPSSGSVAAAGRYVERLRRAARRPLVAAMGERSQRAAGEAGLQPDAVAPDASIEAFVHLVRERLCR